MKPSKKDSSNRLGMFFSIALHAGLVVLILYWGFSGSTEYSSNPGPIEVSLSGLETGGGANPPSVKKAVPKPKPPEPEKEEVVEEEPTPPPEPEPEKEEVVEEEPPPPPEPEPEKKEIVKEEPKKEEPKKDVIPIEPEKEEKKEVAKTPEPTAKPQPTEKPKPKATPKPTEKPKPKATEKPKPKPTKKPEKKKDFDKEKDRILKDIQRQKVLDELKNNKPDTQEPSENFEDEIQEEMGEEQRLAMGDDVKSGGEPDSEGSSAKSSSGGSSISPLIIQTYSNQVHRKISRNWTMPPGVSTDGSLSTSVLFKVDANGNVNNVTITKSSGNSVFDSFCKQAIVRSAPLPPPPTELAEEAKNKGVELTFNNKQ